MVDSVTYEAMGGQSALVKINKIFYDKIYQHPWLKQYFSAIPQDRIEHQQVHFMQRVLGGPNTYMGKTPPMAHRHMFISEELFQLRQELLVASFDEANAHPALREKWLALDEVFKKNIVKASPADCIPRLSTEGVLNYPNPNSSRLTK